MTDWNARPIGLSCRWCLLDIDLLSTGWVCAMSGRSLCHYSPNERHEPTQGVFH
jgi:hypothetical protein